MKDIKMTPEGELVIGPDGDFATVEGDEAIAQQLIFILKTQKGDWTLAPKIGADLERFLGQPNTRETRDQIEAAVVSAIIQSGVIYNPTVRCIQISEEEVFITVEFPSIEGNNREIIVASSLDLKTGEVFTRSVDGN